MTVDILRGDIAALPSAGRAEELLPAAKGDSLTLACTDEAVYKAYSFQWNMWFAERKPEHENKA